MRLSHDIAQTGGWLAANQRYSFASASTRYRDARTVRRTVAYWWRGVRDRTCMLISDAPGWLASNKNGGACCSHQGGTMHGAIAEPGCWTSHLHFRHRLNYSFQPKAPISQNSHCIPRIDSAQPLQA
jgi:hypothetical protein